MLQKFLFKNLLNAKLEGKFKYCFFLMLIAGLFELLSISLILPFVDFILNKSDDLIILLSQYISLNPTYDYRKIIIVIFFLVFFFKILFLVYYHYYQSNLSMRIENYLAERILQKYIYSNADLVKNINTSEIINSIIGLTSDVTRRFFIATLSLLVEIITFIFIASYLIYNFTFQAIVFLSFILIFIFIYYYAIRTKLYSLSDSIRIRSEIKIKSIQEGLSSINELKIFNTQNIVVDIFKKQTEKMYDYVRVLSVYKIIPRYIVELLIIASLSIGIYFAIDQNIDIQKQIPTLALIVYVVFRLFPSFNKVLSYLTVIRLSRPSLKRIQLDLVDVKKIITKHKKLHPKRNKSLIFNKNLSLKNISFKYPEADSEVIKNINFSVNKGEKIMLFGKSGCGKSTFIEILCGFKNLKKGKFYLDNRQLNLEKNLGNWFNILSYVPQNIFLFDDTLMNNIVFSESDKNQKIDKKYLKKILSICDLDEFSNEAILSKKIGERGVKLSGGQIKRIGIARAIYKNPKILILDEATANLDKKSEHKIIRNLINLYPNLTILFTTHNTYLKTLFDKTYKFENKNIKLFKYKK
jgi:ABC-type multidrug transport system fused ATPase/permease subunit